MNKEKITKIYLLNVPLENDYKNTLYFTSEENQQSYFKSKVVDSLTLDDSSYQRKDKYIRYPKGYDDLYTCNYVMYQNKAYSNKWFYAFITDLEYINDELTYIHIETDVMQTWMFDYQIKSSFVEREHVSDDTIGKHTLPEGLELGEYISNRHNKDDKLKEGYKFVVASTVAIDGLGDTPEESGVALELYGGMYGGIYTGPRYYTYEADTTVKQDKLGVFLQAVADQSGPEAISSVFMAPKFLCKGGTNQDEEGIAKNTTIPNTSGHEYYDHIENKPFTEFGIDEYHPVNNKLFTYPYCYLHVDNGNGSNAIYHYEYFKNDEMKFHVEGVLCPGCSIRMVPLDYKGSAYSDKEGLNLGKYPVCSWATDSYTNWLTQNSVNVASGYISGAFQGIGGLLDKDIEGTTKGILGIQNTIRQKKNAEMIPPQTSGNVNCGDVNTAAKTNTFHYYHMSIRSEYARIIDEYFTAYGYMVNRFKVPNKAHRSRFWYTKTLDINIDGGIPAKDMEKIKSCYNNGITFWRNANEINDYSLSNGIVKEG